MTTTVRSIAVWALAVVASAAVAGVAGAAPFELPPLVQPPSSERHPGKMIWADLVTPDVAGAKKFYGGVLGWTFVDVRTGAGGYSLALADGVAIAALVQRNISPGERRQPAWLTFLSVNDVADTERIAVANGGKVLSPARSYAQRGRQEVLADPQGAVFAVLQSSSGDPQDVLADQGEWIWSSLQTRDPNTAAGFYQAVFNYDAFDLPSDDNRDHVLLSSDDYARASVNALPSDTSPLHPHWLNFVRVASTADAAAKVTALNGRILVAPHADRHGGIVAVVADPAGAPFGLMEWTEADSKEVAK